ncbi:hypothetical protein BKA67DRAFT_563975 [Truncatella angustata]|uniref:NF-kappa-B inhibitor-like protein 1 n=1 Tax=Truncatella angustata TaxID=152316 RepID=A0A9P8ZYH1_9PEZI|nr:uncharacterized protein BKA67DRAFT_563975 [Truncatella angustata]KAH6654021.1 hypothetical protein BKA67DRAFT_563975 [Truncatella angustata]
MTTEPSSPKRRHILSAYNPEEPPPTSTHEEHNAAPEQPVSVSPRRSTATPLATGDGAAPEYTENHHKSSKFRFKSSRRSRRSSRHRQRDYDDHGKEASHRSSTKRRDGERDDGHDSDRDEHTSSRRHRHHHHHHRHKRRRDRPRTRSPTPPNPHGPPPLSPETAFRESLFDAMADDEGAAYWEGVYGQPVHLYSNQRSGPQGELEQMDDDEYAAYVRQKMWEKTHQGLLEERARRQEQERQKEDKQKEAHKLTKEMEDSLRRGDERRKRKGWRSRWDAYLQAWSEWDGHVETMSWPVAGGSRADISSENVRDFLINGLDPLAIGEKEFLAKLKEERVRWHPDKIQQRLGARFDDSVRQDVTAVFQIIDKLWSDTRSNG